MINGLFKLLLLAGTVLAGTPASAQEAENRISPSPHISCIQDALDERDTTLANMVDNWSSSVKNALETRRDAEKASWDISNDKERRIVQRRAWSDYGKTLRAANSEKTKERARAWKKFENDRQQCEGIYSPEMTSGRTYDKNL